MKLDSTDTLINLVNNLAAVAPTMLAKREPLFDPTLLSHWLGKNLAFELLSALNEVRIELVPKYAEDRLLVNAFWDELICQTVADHQLYFDGSKATFDLIKAFGNRWKTPLSKFEVIYSLDYLRIGESPITILGVEFFTPSDADITERAIPKSAVDRWRKHVNTLTLAVVKVDASSSNTAFETGKEQLVDALVLLKASALCGLAGTLLPEEFVQWKLSGHYIVNPISVETPTHRVWGIQDQFGPIVRNLSSEIEKGIDTLGINLLCDIPKDVRERVTRALNWVAHSATHDTDDYRLVDLCTALEILLLPEGRRTVNKGTVIALRYNLIGGDLNPSAVKWMYDRRNDVIHGDPLPVVRQQDTWDLRLVCYPTIRKLVYASVKRPDLIRLEDLMASVETKERLEKFLGLVDMGIYEGSLLHQLVKEAEKKLKKITC